MATSNFYSYEDYPNLYFTAYDEIEEVAMNDGIIYDPEDEENYYDRMDQFVKDYYGDYRILNCEEVTLLEKAIEDCNDIIKAKGDRLYYESPRQRDQEEGDYLREVTLSIEPGHYEGAQIKINGYYQYLNKTNQSLIRKLMVKLAKQFRLYSYSLAYRFSNGETGFSLAKKY